MTLHITGDPEADELLTRDPLALLIGMLLDQQVPMETAFAGPKKIRERTGALDAAAIAGADPDEFAAMFKVPPSVHRFPGSMAGRVQALCAEIRDRWGGDAAAIWTDGNPDGPEVLRRLEALPGFGAQKAKIFLALLGKQYGYDGRWLARGIRPLRRGGVVSQRRRHRLARLARQGPRAQEGDEGGEG